MKSGRRRMAKKMANGEGGNALGDLLTLFLPLFDDMSAHVAQDCRAKLTWKVEGKCKKKHYSLYF